MKTGILIIAVIIFSTCTSFSQVEDKLLHALKTNNLEEFITNYKEPYLNEGFGKDSLQALAYAVFFYSNDIVKWLLDKGAEVNSFSGGLTPVMWAARSGNSEAIELLIESRAGVNLKDEDGNTALIYASAKACLECVKMLVYSGADIEAKNSYGFDAEFYAMRAQSLKVRNFLRYHVIQSDLKSRELRDGPHFRWIDKNKVNAFYFLSKANDDRVKIKAKTFKTGNLPYTLKGFSGDTGSYIMYKNYDPQQAVYEDKNKIFVVGDIHGDYDQTISILKNSGVIRNDLRWNWGNGHLVFIGDIFDRGDKVTELLWFIHALQKQANETNGHVHLILGNHEIMNLLDDTRYISDKYFYLSSKTGIAYSEIFGLSYELGKWLRSLNTMIKIDDILFVHAGISREMVQKNLSIREVNNAMRDYLSSVNDTSSNELGIFLSGEYGPLWFRGFIGEESDLNPELKQDFENSLDLYDTRKIIVGHTPAQNFRLDFDNRLIYIDVSSAKGNEDEKALLIENDNYFKVYEDGSLKPLFE